MTMIRVMSTLPEGRGLTPRFQPLEVLFPRLRTVGNYPASHPGIVVVKDSLLARSWNTETLPSNCHLYAKRLRRAKIEPLPSLERLLETEVRRLLLEPKLQNHQDPDELSVIACMDVTMFLQGFLQE